MTPTSTGLVLKQTAETDRNRKAFLGVNRRTVKRLVASLLVLRSQENEVLWDLRELLVYCKTFLLQTRLLKSKNVFSVGCSEPQDSHTVASKKGGTINTLTVCLKAFCNFTVFSSSKLFPLDRSNTYCADIRFPYYHFSSVRLSIWQVLDTFLEKMNEQLSALKKLASRRQEITHAKLNFSYTENLIFFNMWKKSPVWSYLIQSLYPECISFSTKVIPPPL